MTTYVARRGNIPSAMAWMIGLSAVLFWIPVVGGLIAGFVGGRKAGGVGPAIAAALLPAFILWLLTIILGGLLGWIPIIGALFGMIAGMGNLVVSVLNVVPLLIGAVVGGMTAKN